MKISSVIKWLRNNINRIFPDRQLYFRTNGDVRFISISKNTQIFVSTLTMCIVIWCSLASYNYIYISEILSDKDSEVDVANRNYNELENQFSQLKEDIQKSAVALEQRQRYIQQIIDEEKIDGPVSPAENITIDDAAVVDSDYDEDDKEARNNYRNKNLDRIYVGLKRIEIQQNNTVNAILNKVDNKLSFLKAALDNAGIAEEKILALAADLPSSAAQGGPFIELENGINDAPINSASFDELYMKRNNLKDLEMAIAYLPIATPPEKYYISSKFGVRRDPITKKWASHKGLDMAGWHKTPIKAGGAGVVTKAGRNGSFGLFVEIDHGNGFRSKYGHLSQVKVERGDRVEADQLIGLMGSTGRSVSTHLHYEIWFNGKPIDPLKVLKAAKDVQKIKQQEYDS